jgi:transformation/transcription domain-associated protein
MRFLTWFANSSHTWTQKAFFVQYIITPILLVHATRSKQVTNLINSDFINQVHQLIWQPTNDAATFSETDAMFKIEMLHLTTILVQYYPDLLDDARKNIMKYAWLHDISSSDDVIVKQLRLHTS